MTQIKLAPDSTFVTYDNGDGVERVVNLVDFDVCEYFADTRVVELRVIGNAYQTARIMLRNYRQPTLMADNIISKWRTSRLDAKKVCADT